jgi:uncharacterized protein (DUF433 family)
MARRRAMVKVEAASQVVVRHPRVQGGEPVIRGTRVPVRAIVIAAAEYGGDLARAGRAFSVDAAAVRAALAYYEQHKAEIDQVIEQHERAALP